MSKLDTDIELLVSRYNAHLTFNVLTTIQGFLLENEPNQAFELVGSYSSLLRRMLIHDCIDTSLKDEIALTTDYLDIEKVRFDNGFQYSIRVPKTLLGQRVPKSLLFGLVENALKHGVRPLLDTGYIKIDCPKLPSPLLRVRNNAPITSEANGLGMGFGITAELLKKFNQLTGSIISMTMCTRNLRIKKQVEFETLISLPV